MTRDSRKDFAYIMGQKGGFRSELFFVHLMDLSHTFPARISCSYLTSVQIDANCEFESWLTSSPPCHVAVHPDRRVTYRLIWLDFLHSDLLYQ